ncbi:patatin-like phospholipase family protein [Psychromarinibacter halotolerans]|uniref:Patatin-like phospholipase family protein n=1 Tax=Psychromarinibacter halotolerans TaxID=1775175 RepID=A0ABV7GUG6_9RHOB|nr:patatin-like phospholipase family protein [Psychromarinibacter halotolerans]MDF0594931.1 patatin-like phospholipase family protein [Psychromarinibacter halotolerans]
MKKQINLALQGGGAHGAFTWGVLDRLLEEPDIEIAAVSGTSAGALNAAALKAGMARGGAQAARDNLAWLWEQMGALDTTLFPDWARAFWPAPATMSRLVALSPAYLWTDMASRVLSPYALGPLYENPLKRVVEYFRFEDVCSDAGPRLFVSATNVRNGKIRVFSGDTIHADVILASACLPNIFQAVEIEDPVTGTVEAYWDGGYTGNPALFPMYEPDLPDDIVIVNINPLYREEVPRTAQEIQNRINEISFNSSLLRELRAISFVRDLIAAGRVPEGTMKRVLVHMIADDELMNMLSEATKIVPTPSVLSDLRDSGRRRAGAFLEDHKDKIGVEASVNLEEMFG